MRLWLWLWSELRLPLTLIATSLLSLYVGLWIGTTRSEVAISNLRVELMQSLNDQRNTRKEDLARLAELTIRFDRLDSNTRLQLTQILQNTETIKDHLGKQ